MEKTKLRGLYGDILKEYGTTEGVVSVSYKGVCMEAAALNIPVSMKIGDQQGYLIMVHKQSADGDALCFLEVESWQDDVEGKSLLWYMMQPQEVGFQRVMQRAWALGMAEGENWVMGNFIGGHGISGRPAIIIAGKFFRFYMEVLSRCTHDTVSDLAIV